MNVDTSRWSGEGTFTQTLIDHLKTVDEIAELRVEDAPASRSDADFNFISNEIFVTFATSDRRESIRRLGFIPGSRVVSEKTLRLADLAARLEAIANVGAADYTDDGMIQYLRTERIIPPYQTRGYKLVELVRIYEGGIKRYRDQ